MNYGWKKDKPDDRDFHFRLDAPMATLPAKVDLRPQCPPVYDQGQLGSCTANSIGGVHEFEQMKQGQKNPFTPSRLFIYYNERVMEGTVSEDAGAEIRDGMKSIAAQGVPPEKYWPYNIAKFTKKPTCRAYKAALKHQALQYMRVGQDLNSLKQCLAAGNPIVFGFAVYASFESQEVASTGVVPMPQSGEQNLGGHAVVLVGYDDASQRFIVRNSWGPDWGQAGYFTMPYAYVTNPSLSSDFWTIQLVE